MSYQTEWRVVPFAPDYEVSWCGRVRRLTAARTRRAGHELKRTLTGSRYIRVKLIVDGHKREFGVHQLVAAAFHGEPPFEGALIRHLDDNPHNNWWENLAYGDRIDNAQDWLRNSGPKHGTNNHNAKLKDEDIPRIRAMFDGTFGCKSRIARAFGVGFTAINDVLTGRKWSHV